MNELKKACPMNELKKACLVNELKKACPMNELKKACPMNELYINIYYSSIYLLQNFAQGFSGISCKRRPRQCAF
jgi:hypothetical protein